MKPQTLDQLRPGERFHLLTGKGRVLDGSPVYIKGPAGYFCVLQCLLDDKWHAHIDYPVPVRKIVD